MKIRPAYLLCLVLIAGPALDRAQGDPPPDAAPPDEGQQQSDPAEAAARAMRDRLASDPAVQGSLAERIARSKLAQSITAKTDPIGKIADIQAWIRANPDAATKAAIGLAQDDAEGDHRFEDMATRGGDAHLVENAGAQGNLFNRLKKAGLDSKLMKQEANKNMADEEKNELVKKMFDGQGGATNRVLTQQAGGGAAAGVLNSGYYDRLSAGNLHGYSPQLQALQSALNARGAPGAPKLIETGKLDYETLSYPRYGMRYDIENLRKRLAYERAWALATLLGREKDFTQEQLMDPAVQALLEKQAGDKAAKLSPRFLKRLAALDKAAAALADFENAALPAQDPLRISAVLLRSLGGKQREAARWITVAGLEEELQRLDAEEGFLSPELDAQIERCPVAPDVKASYRRRGQEYQKTLKALKDGDESASARLESDDWLARLDDVQRTLDQCGALRKDLHERVADYVATPFRLSSLNVDKPRWRQILDDWWMSWLPGTSYGRRLRSLKAQTDLLKDVFAKIASGDLDAAHTILVSSGAPAI